MVLEYHTPRKPFSVVDAYNRSAAAKGSPAYAQASVGGSYDGRCATLRWNEYRQYYVCQYTWSGNRVVCRDKDLMACLSRALAWYDKQGRGAQLKVFPRVEDRQYLAIAVLEGKLFPATAENVATFNAWHTWRHDVAHRSAPDYCRQVARIRFDLELLEAADSEEEYVSALTEKYGDAYGY